MKYLLIIIISVLNAQEFHCPLFNPEPWNNTEVSFKGKLFVKDNVFSIAHIPFGMEKVMTRIDNVITATDAKPKTTTINLSDSESFWSTTIFVEATKVVPGEEMTEFDGTYYSRVYEGPYKDAGKWVKDMNGWLNESGKENKGLLFYYPICPECTKELYGHQITVLLAKL